MELQGGVDVIALKQEPSGAGGDGRGLTALRFSAALNYSTWRPEQTGGSPARTAESGRADIRGMDRRSARAAGTQP
mgnify:CR=1 FL=1